MGECEPLPVGGFKWMTEKEIENWENIPYILEVVMEYPEELHDLHNNYPLAPESVTVNRVEKLIPNPNHNEKYVIHHRNLKPCLALGMEFKKIHRGIRFDEKPWLKIYVEKNKDLRKGAKTSFEKYLFKLMNNSVFGKTMENIRKQVDVKFVNNRKSAETLSARPNFRHLTIFDENLVAVHMKRRKLVFNKPVYCGMCILELSKTLMDDFHHDNVKPKYASRAKLIFTDTESLMYEIETEDVHEDIKSDVQYKFDTSDFPADHPSGIQRCNKKVIGTMKDEAAGTIIEEFVGLRAKLYRCTLEQKRRSAKE
ncbi:uncharacterized protein LOC110041301 [Orbicella faveolata]|uniref:uncharacterized protein LOC110041301 n=1 Tax=Orbicella faveolata TaxID=48498 RepID=UPI0009E3E747|nr:uncharacterized protein LOC110041301 [Orbicella faveolata]